MGEARKETFEVGGNPKVELKNLPSGHASFLPGEDGKVEVEVSGRHVDEFEIEGFGDRISLQAPGRLASRWDSFEVTVRVPDKVSTLGVNVASADVDIEADIKTLGFNSASGDLKAGNVTGDAGANTASGDVAFESVGGKLGVNTASGDVRVREVGGDLGANSASGDLRVEHARSDLEFQSASGDLVVGNYDGGSLTCNIHSGDARIAIPPGRTLEVDLNTLAGDIHNELEDGVDGEESEGNGATSRLRVKTISGDITLARAKT